MAAEWIKNRIVETVRGGMFQGLWSRAVHLGRIGQGFYATTISASGELAVLKRFASAKVVFDVGANEGDYAEAAAAACPGATIHSFEPSQTAYGKLRARVGSNPAIRLHHVALGAEEGTAELHHHEPGDTIGSLLDIRDPVRPFDPALTETVRITTLDRFCGEQGIGHIDFLKIDVEGLELDVLRGAQSLIAANAIGAVQFEFGVGNVDARTFLRDFYDLLQGYDFFRITPAGLQSLGAYSNDHEVFLPCNYLAIRRADRD